MSEIKKLIFTGKDQQIMHTTSVFSLFYPKRNGPYLKMQGTDIDFQILFFFLVRSEALRLVNVRLKNLHL